MRVFKGFFKGSMRGFKGFFKASLLVPSEFP